MLKRFLAAIACVVALISLGTVASYADSAHSGYITLIGPNGQPWSIGGPCHTWWGQQVTGSAVNAYSTTFNTNGSSGCYEQVILRYRDITSGAYFTTYSAWADPLQVAVAWCTNCQIIYSDHNFRPYLNLTAVGYRKDANGN